MSGERGAKGVLLMAYGAPSSLAEIPAYLKDIRGGRVPSPELVSELAGRYRLIGGGSPLLDISKRQAAALEARLNAQGDGPWRVRVGMRHSEPGIYAALGELEASAELFALALTPYESSASVGAYLEKLRAAASGRRIRTARAWWDAPALLDAFARKAREALERLGAPAAETLLLFTAHSLPERLRAGGDPYAGQFESAAARVAERLGHRLWRRAYQSKAQGAGEPWLGPDAAQVLGEARGLGARAVALAPIGFISDHLETLYDVDVLYRGLARESGLAFERAASLNDDPGLIEALAGVLRSPLEEL